MREDSSPSKSEDFDELRAMQISFIEEQIQLQKTKQKNAKTEQGEAIERLEILKIQRQTAETNAKEAQERLKLAIIQCEIASLELQKQKQQQANRYV